MFEEICCIQVRIMLKLFNLLTVTQKSHTFFIIAINFAISDITKLNLFSSMVIVLDKEEVTGVI